MCRRCAPSCPAVSCGPASSCRARPCVLPPPCRRAALLCAVGVPSLCRRLSLGITSCRRHMLSRRTAISNTGLLVTLGCAGFDIVRAVVLVLSCLREPCRLVVQRRAVVTAYHIYRIFAFIMCRHVPSCAVMCRHVPSCHRRAVVARGCHHRAAIVPLCCRGVPACRPRACHRRCVNRRRTGGVISSRDRGLWLSKDYTRSY